MQNYFLQGPNVSDYAWLGGGTRHRRGSIKYTGTGFVPQALHYQGFGQFDLPNGTFPQQGGEWQDIYVANSIRLVLFKSFMESQHT